MTDQPEHPEETSEYKYSEHFISAYANNVRFASSIWDLKMLFGEVLSYGPHAVIEQHAAVTVSWLQAKVMALFLSVNVASREAVDGPIRIPKTLLADVLHSIADKELTLQQMYDEVFKVAMASDETTHIT